MNRNYRLTKTNNIKRVRRLGKSFAHPLIVLIKHPNHVNKSRFGIIAGKSIGTAVERNRCKRRIREAIRFTLPSIQPGWDIIILARVPLASATYEELQAALTNLLKRAELFIN